MSTTRRCSQRTKKQTTKNVPNESNNSSGTAYCDSKWSEDELKALLQALQQLGTGNVDLLAGRIKTRTAAQVGQYLRYVRFAAGRVDMEENMATLADTDTTDACPPVDSWLSTASAAEKQPASCEKSSLTDRTAAVAASLRLAALHEHKLFTGASGNSARRLHDFSEVYLYLAALAENQVPPSPSAATSRHLLSLLHHLAALVKNIDIAAFERWIYQCKRASHRHTTTNTTTNSTTDSTTDSTAKSATYGLSSNNRRDQPDMSLIPASVKDIVSILAEADTNPLHVPAALLLSPLSSVFSGQAVPSLDGVSESSSIVATIADSDATSGVGSSVDSAERGGECRSTDQKGSIRDSNDGHSDGNHSGGHTAKSIREDPAPPRSYSCWDSIGKETSCSAERVKNSTSDITSEEHTLFVSGVDDTVHNRSAIDTSGVNAADQQPETDAEPSPNTVMMSPTLSPIATTGIFSDIAADSDWNQCAGEDERANLVENSPDAGGGVPCCSAGSKEPVCDEEVTKQDHSLPNEVDGELKHDIDNALVNGESVSGRRHDCRGNIAMSDSVSPRGVSNSPAQSNARTPGSDSDVVEGSTVVSRKRKFPMNERNDVSSCSRVCR